ncbi:MAG TPA: glutaredoxin family protein [Nevskiaceae bacterium]|nr:glutaredoxin family protein [Nevskiaceae bacterium]
MTETPPRFLLLGRADCPLCEELYVHVLEALAGRPAEVESADVDSRPEWQRRYGLRIPVLLDAWNEVVCEGRFDAQAFEEALRARP